MSAADSHLKHVMDRLLDRLLVEDPLEDLKLRLRKFVAERRRQTLNSPKNLSMALTVEAGELLEHFQWLTEEQSRNLNPEQTAEVRHELADIFLYLIRLADELNVDLVKAANEKMIINNQKYPV